MAGFSSYVSANRCYVIVRLQLSVTQLFNRVIFTFFQGKVYLFDKVFKPNASQEKVYNEAARTIVAGK